MNEEERLRRRAQRLKEAKPWWRAGMTEEEYGHLLAFVAANPRLVHRMIVTFAEEIERQRAEKGASE